MLKIDVQGPKDKREVIAMTFPYLLGRSNHCHLILPDFSISRQHARIVQIGDTLTLEDLGSTNGIIVDDKPVEKIPITHGLKAQLGNYTLSFSLEEEGSTTYIKSLEEFKQEFGLSLPNQKTGKTVVKATTVKQAKLLSMMVQMARTLLEVREKEEVLNTVLDLAFDILPAERGFILLIQDGKLTPLLARNRSGPLDTEDLPMSSTILNTVIQEKIALITHDAMVDERFEAGQSVVLHNIRSALCVPLWREHEVLGAIYVDSPIKAGSFSTEDLDLLTALANYAAVALHRSLLEETIKEERRIRDKLVRYHSPTVVEHIVQSKIQTGAITLPSFQPEITVFFADVVGFTQMAAHLSPDCLITLLNGFFTVAAQVIFHYEGTLDKFIGDAVMAFFGAPIHQNDHPDRGVEAAIALMQEVRRLGEGMKQEGLPPYHIRIGIHSGKAVVGDVGSDQRLEYTALGHTVNVASRLEEMVAQPDEIIISEETRGRLTKDFPLIEKEPVQLKGLDNPLRVWSVPWEKIKYWRSL